tara:strand:- start:1 stop:2439 length:2439 start_codon:yes stop_codon:yes gene_type:complete
MAVSSYGASVVLQNNSGSAAASAAPTGSVFLFASGAQGSAKLFMNKEGSQDVFELGADLKIAGDSGTGTVGIGAGQTLTIAGGTGLDTSASNQTITFSMDLNELSAAAVSVANDSIAIIDADDSNGSKKESIADLMTAVAGDGLAASSGVLAVGVDDSTVELNSDALRVKAAGINVSHLNTAVAGDGLSGGGGSALALDLNELTAAAVAVGADSIAIIDADDNSSKKESIADLATAMAGDGLAASSGVFAVGVDDSTVELNSDAVRVKAAGINVSHLNTAVAGNGLAGGGGSALSLDLNELSAAAVAVGADSIAIIDADDNSSKKESIADLATAMAGDGLAASSGVFAVQVGTNKGLALTSDKLEITGSAVAAEAVAVGTDTFMFFDADGSVKEESFADLATAQAGDGLAASSGVLAVQVDDTGIELNSDALRLKDNGVTLAKMAGITRGSIIVGDASGDPSLLGKGTAAQFLQSDGTDPSYVTISGDATIAAGGAVTLAAAQTNVTSLLATDIKIGEDDQTKIDFETADEIHFYAANAEQVYVADGVLGPQTDSDVDLGADGVAFKKLFVDDIDLNGQGRIDLDADGDTSIRAAADDQIRLEAGGTDIVTVTASGMAVGAGAGSGGLSLGGDGTGNFDGGVVCGVAGTGAGFRVFGANSANNEMIYSRANNNLSFKKDESGSQETVLTIGGDANTDFAIEVANGSDNINKIKAAAFVTYSDESLKSEVTSMGNTALDAVMSLNGVEFTWKDSGERDFGFIAQDVQKVVPKAVHTGNDGVQGVDYSRLTSVLVEAVKAQQVQIEELKALLKK